MARTHETPKAMAKHTLMHVADNLTRTVGTYRTLAGAMFEASRFLAEAVQDESAGYVLATPWTELESGSGITMAYLYANENGPVPGAEEQRLYILSARKRIPESDPAGKEGGFPCPGSAAQ